MAVPPRSVVRTRTADGQLRRVRSRVARPAAGGGLELTAGMLRRERGTPPPFYRPMSPLADWLWDPIPINPVLDPESAAWTTRLPQPAVPVVLSMYEFAVPIYDIPADVGPNDVPTYTIDPAEVGGKSSRRCMASKGLGVREEVWVAREPTIERAGRVGQRSNPALAAHARGDRGAREPGS